MWCGWVCFLSGFQTRRYTHTSKRKAVRKVSYISSDQLSRQIHHCRTISMPLDSWAWEPELPSTILGQRRRGWSQRSQKQRKSNETHVTDLWRGSCWERGREPFEVPAFTISRANRCWWYFFSLDSELHLHQVSVKSWNLGPRACYTCSPEGLISVRTQFPDVGAAANIGAFQASCLFCRLPTRSSSFRDHVALEEVIQFLSRWRILESGRRAKRRRGKERKGKKEGKRG